jgi:hypothetical protein
LLGCVFFYKFKTEIRRNNLDDTDILLSRIKEALEKINDDPSIWNLSKAK